MFFLGLDVDISSDLPGLVKLLSNPRNIRVTVSAYIAQESTNFPEAKYVREAAIAQFPHPSDTTWTGLDGLGCVVVPSNLQ